MHSIKIFQDTKEASILLAQNLLDYFDKNPKATFLISNTHRLEDFYFFLTHLADENWINFDRLRYFADISSDIDDRHNDPIYEQLDKLLVSKSDLVDLYFPTQHNFFENFDRYDGLDVAVLYLKEDGRLILDNSEALNHSSSTDIEANKIILQSKDSEKFFSDSMFKKLKDQEIENIYSTNLAMVYKADKIYIFASGLKNFELINKFQLMNEYDPKIQLSYFHDHPNLEIIFVKDDSENGQK